MKDITKEIIRQIEKQEKEEIKAKFKKPLESCVCKRCSYEWKPYNKKKKLPTTCPHCRSKYWESKRIRLVCARCEYEWWQKMGHNPERCTRCNCKIWDNTDLHELNREIHWLEQKIKEKEEKERC